ncbi:MAG: bifunctional precorrin-2 dehydrogenase/sirohydrochlorin ferrochelatase [Dethiobacter sp.]|jgi:precorrin-2 dehydrogenase/sirohydrochlorin ferrochelatase|nr:bifunctional precorrin-2 dehydrogenase/sirohydrochlorin ferrochelatase [Dethiobacter sp.]MBS3898318.1 bifunctional precorrin-2 dehydrogenase/sirohydrochlorin ferrochelatase [Dethiobacter sp.]
MINYYPVFLALQGKLCLVVGGGDVAARKVASLLECGAAVRVVSPTLLPELETLTEQGQIAADRRPYAPNDIGGASLVIAATNQPAVNRLVALHCQQRKIPVNVVDAPELCDFLVPATIRRGPLTIAVSTGGTLPAMARKIRRKLEEDFDQNYGLLLAALGFARSRVLEEIVDSGRRKRIFCVLAAADLLSVVEAEGVAALEKEIERLIAVTL